MDEAASLGADRLIDRSVLPSAVFGVKCVDVVIDAVGGPAWPDLLEVLKPNRRYPVSGAIGGPMVGLDLRRLYLKDLTLLGCTAQSLEGFLALVKHIERGEIRSLIAGEYPLRDLVTAPKAFVEKQHIGKLIVVSSAQCPASEVRWIEIRSESGHELFILSGLLIPYARRAERRISVAGH